MRRWAAQLQSNRGGPRLGLALALLVALVLRGLTPAGWMPNPQGSLSAPFVICTAEGHRLVQLDASGHPADGKAGVHRDACVFAGHASAPPPQPPAVSGPAVFVGYSAPRPAGRTPPPAPARHREQAPRAPPAAI